MKARILHSLTVVIITLVMSGCATTKSPSIAKKGFTGVGLAAYYPFNGNANDESGNGYNDSVGNAVLTTDRFGKPNSAYEFNGKNSVIEILKGSELILNDSITVTAWINPTADTLAKKGQSTIFVQNDVNAGKVTHQVRLRTGKLEYDNWNPRHGWTASQTNIEANKWSHIAVVRDGNDVKIYINGLLNASGTGEPRVDASNVDNVLIGSRYYKKSLRDGFQGKLDEIRIYNTALTEQEIKKHYGVNSEETSKIPLDKLAAYWSMDIVDINAETQRSEGKYVNTSIDEDGKLNQSVHFNGQSSYVDFGDNLDDVFVGPDRKFTITMWVKPSKDHKYGTLLAKHGDTGCTQSQNQRQIGLRLQSNTAANLPNFWIQSPSGGQYVMVQSDKSLNKNEWSFLAVTYDGSIDRSALERFKILVNGRETNLSIDHKGKFPFDLQDSSAHLSLGDHVDGEGQICQRKGQRSFEGHLDEVAIWDEVLTHEQIEKIRLQDISGVSILNKADGPIIIKESSDEPCCDLNGEFSYSGDGIATIKQSGNDIQMYLTWKPKGKGPHYEIKGTLLGNIITGKWFSHYDNKGWFDFNGIVSPSGKMIDFSKTYDPLGSAMNNIVIFNKSLLTDPEISVIEAGSVDGYMSNQEMQLRSKLEGTGIIVSREKKHIILKLSNNITFDTDSDLLKPRFTPILKSIVLVLKEFNSTLVTTIGHTDNVGADEYNQTLSEKRAKSLSNYLSNNGVNEKRLTSIGKGKFQPVSSNDTSSGRAANRRVEIMLEPLYR